MKIFDANTKRLLKANSTGIIIGGVIGAVAASYAISQGADLTSLASAGKGALDAALGRSASVTELATYKLYAVFISIGAAIGFVVDVYVK